MLTFKDYQKETIYEAYSPDMNRELGSTDIKTLSNVLIGDYTLNIQASNFAKLTNYVGTDGKFVYNARKSYSNNPIVVVMDKTRKTIHVARFGYSSNGSNSCYVWNIGRSINRRETYKMTHFNYDMENAVKSNHDLSVFVCENPVSDRRDIRNARAELSAVPDKGTINDRLARQKFEKMKDEFYLLGKNSTIKACVTKLNKNSLEVLKKSFDAVDPSTSLFGYKIRDCVKDFDKIQSSISKYEIDMETMERMIKDNKYETYWDSLEKTFSYIKLEIDNLKKFGIWK